MEGGSLSGQSWLTQYKLALIEEDFEQMEELNKALPQFDTIAQMEEAQAYIKQSASILLQKQKELRKNMNDIISTKKYLNS